MRLHVWLLGAAGLLYSGAASAQTLSNASLSGKYYFVQLLVTATGGTASNAQNLSGAMTFDGKGAYTYAGKAGTGPGGQSASSGSGTYSVSSAGVITMSDAIKSTLQMQARLSADGIVVLGASTEASDNTNDVFVAIKAPATTLTNVVLSGAYTGASMQFPNGASSAMKTAVLSLTPSGNGQFSRITVVGQSADQGGKTASQDATNGSSYSINGDGTGSANFGGGASLFSGVREIFVSQDGSYIIGDSTANGGRDIFIATKNFSASANLASLSDRYWIVELTVQGTDFSDAAGAFFAFGDGRVLLSERVHLPTGPVDFSGINSYLVNSNSTGNLSPLIEQGVNNMALGVSATVGGKAVPQTLLGAQIVAVNETTTSYGLAFAVRAPAITGSGVFIDPSHVVNGATFAPLPYPLGLGAIASLFGSGLASGTSQASTIPLPTTLGGVQVQVNGTPVPLFYVSPTQINFQTPFGLTGSTVTIQVVNNGAQSNTVTAPVARTSPGIFQYSDCGSTCGVNQSANRGIVLHSDFSLVTSAKPATAGETVIIYLTGLGPLNPAVETGAANPSAAPLAVNTDPLLQILFGGEVAPQSSVLFAGGAPAFVGLNQINVTIPLTVIGGGSVPVAISTTNAFSDIVDIPMQ